MQDLENSQDLRSALDRFWRPCDVFANVTLLEETCVDALAIAMIAPGPVRVIMIARYPHTPLFLVAIGRGACDFVAFRFGRDEERG